MTVRGARTIRRVAVVAACSFPSPRGSQVLVQSVAEQLARLGHEVHLITYGSRAAYLPPAGVFWHSTGWAAGGPARPGLRWTKLPQNLMLLALLWRVVVRERIEVVHAHNYEAPLLSFIVRWATGVPVVYHAHNALGDELARYAGGGWRARFAARLGRWLDEHIPRRADHAVALTPELAEFLATCGVPPDRITVVAPAGLPQAPAVSANLEPRAARFAVTYAGNLDAYQDLDVLVEAFALVRSRLPTAFLTVVTHETAWRPRLDPRVGRWVDEGAAAVRVEPDFAGVTRWLSVADVLVCPRSSWSGYPIKLLNYAQTGRPIVVARGSAKGLGDGETALLFDDRDAEGLASAVLRLQADPALAVRLGRAAQEVLAAAGPENEEIAFKFERIHGKIAPSHG